VRGVWVMLLLAAALSLSPVDVSLRVRPRGPTLAEAVIGVPLSHGSTGDYVVVGGCSHLYNKPRWVWVW
jgi:hypothetical protein